MEMNGDHGYGNFEFEVPPLLCFLFITPYVSILTDSWHESRSFEWFSSLPSWAKSNDSISSSM